MKREAVGLCAAVALAVAGSWGCARSVSRGEFSRLQSHVVNQTTMLESLVSQQGDTAEQVNQVQQGSHYLESEIAYLKSQVSGPASAAAGPGRATHQPSVREIQHALKQAGFYRGNLDGKIGPLTKEAIIEFQKANGLKVDGVVGRETWGKMSHPA